MFTPVDYISVSKSASNVKTPEVAGSIASNSTPTLFTTTTETAGPIASAASCASSGSLSVSA